MPYYINDECIGCTICAKKCPVPCIWGGEVHVWAKTKEFHIIAGPDCIECSTSCKQLPLSPWDYTRTWLRPRPCSAWPRSGSIF